jgi:hypothetical protein
MTFSVGTKPVAIGDIHIKPVFSPKNPTMYLFNLKGVRVGFIDANGKALGINNRPLPQGIFLPKKSDRPF